MHQEIERTVETESRRGEDGSFNILTERPTDLPTYQPTGWQCSQLLRPVQRAGLTEMETHPSNTIPRVRPRGTNLAGGFDVAMMR